MFPMKAHGSMLKFKHCTAHINYFCGILCTTDLTVYHLVQPFDFSFLQIQKQHFKPAACSRRFSIIAKDNVYFLLSHRKWKATTTYRVHSQKGHLPRVLFSFLGGGNKIKGHFCINYSFPPYHKKNYLTEND